MITLAKSQTQSKVFAGILIPYSLKKKKVDHPEKKIPGKIALLGGGDIAFPLLFAGVVMKQMGMWQALIIPFFALLGLGALLFFAKKDKFYPAMPFISGGCFLGLLIVWLVGLI
jgi:presenilin-like A22 family membrane protease